MAARFGGWPGIQRRRARLVRRKWNVPEGVAGPDEGGTAGERYGKEIRESSEEKAGRLVRQELKRIGWKEADLEKARKGAPKKVKIALRLRQETTMTLAWIARRLHMGTKTSSYICFTGMAKTKLTTVNLGWLRIGSVRQFSDQGEKPLRLSTSEEVNRQLPHRRGTRTFGLLLGSHS